MESRKGSTSSDLKGETKKSETKKCFTKQGIPSVGSNHKMRKNSNGEESKKGKDFPEKENKNCSKSEKVEKGAMEKETNDVDSNLSYKKLRKKLNNLNYKGSLCLSCTPLVQIIFDDLIQAIQNFQKLSDKYEDSQRRYKELVKEKRKNNSQMELKEGGDGEIGNSLFLSGEYREGDDRPNQVEAGVVPDESNRTAQNEHSLSGASKQYEHKISELCKQVEEECKLKETYMKENKKLKFTLEMLQNEKKDKLDESTENISADDFSSLKNRTKSFDDFEIDKIKKKEKKLCQMGSSLINEHTISLGKELSYYKNLCKEFKVEIDRIRKESDGEHPTQGENKKGWTDENAIQGELLVEEKNTEIKYLKERLSEYEMEIRKLNELRMMNDIKEKKEFSDEESACESTSSEFLNGEHTMCNFDPDEDTLSGDMQTKNGSSVRKDSNLSKIVKSRNREIYHLKNRVKLLETELQMKNEEEKKYEKLHRVGDNRAGELLNDNPSNGMDIKGSGSYGVEEEEMRKRRELERELQELQSVLEGVKAELKEEKKRSDKYEKKYNEERCEIGILKDELKNLEKQIKVKESEFNLNKNTINNLKLESAEFNNIMSFSNETKKHLTEYIHNLLNKLSEGNDKMDELKDGNILHKQKIEVYKNEIKKLKEDLIDSSNQVDEFASLLDKKDEVIQGFKEKLENVNKQYGDLTIQYNEVLKENKNLQITNSSHSANSTLIIQQLQQEIHMLNVTNSHLKKIEDDYKIILQEKTIIEDAAIKIQSELKKSVDKIKNLETYIHTLSVEIANLKTQRDDSLDALTKVAIDKTQYENEVIQSKSIIHDLRKQLSEYKSNVKHVENNICEINKMHIEKEEQEIMLKNEIKSLRENLNEKTIKLELLQEKESKFEQNTMAYNEFHMEAQKKYNSYEKMIQKLKKEIDELTINNNDNIIIIEKLKSELDTQQRNNVCDFSKTFFRSAEDLVRAGGVDIPSGEDCNIDKEEFPNRHSESDPIREERNKTKSDKPKGDFYQMDCTNNEQSKDENEMYDYDDDFTIFINSNKNSFGKKYKSGTEDRQEIRIREDEEDGIIDSLNDLLDDQRINGLSPTNKMMTDDGSNVGESKEIDHYNEKFDSVGRNEKSGNNQRMNESESSSNSRSSNMDFLSFSKKERRKKSATGGGPNLGNDQSTVTLKGLTLSALNSGSNNHNDGGKSGSWRKNSHMGCTGSDRGSSTNRSNNRNNSNDSNNSSSRATVPRDKLCNNLDDYCGSENSSSYLGNHDVSLFNSSKIKDIFNLKSMNKGVKNGHSKDEKKFVRGTSQLKDANKKNAYDISGSKSKREKMTRNESYEDILFDFKRDWSVREDEPRGEVVSGGGARKGLKNGSKNGSKSGPKSGQKKDPRNKPSNEYPGNDSESLPYDKTYQQKEKMNKIKNRQNGKDDYRSKYPAYNTDEDDETENYVEKEGKGQDDNYGKNQLRKSNYDTKNLKNSADYPLRKGASSRKITTLQMSNSKNKIKDYSSGSKKKNDLVDYNIQRSTARDKIINRISKDVIDTRGKAKKESSGKDYYNDDEGDKRSYNFISQTSYEANSNTSSILLDSVSSDFAQSSSVEQYNHSVKKKPNESLNYLNFKKESDYNNILCSSNDSHILSGANKLGGKIPYGKTWVGEKHGRVDKIDMVRKNSNSNPNEKKNELLGTEEGENNSYRNVSSPFGEKTNNKIEKAHMKEVDIEGKPRKEQMNNNPPNNQDLYNKYMGVLQSLKSEEMDASVNTTNNVTIDLTNDFSKTQENSTSILSSSKTLQKDSVFSNLSKFKFNEELHEYNCDPLMIIKPIEDSNREPY
ncbi:conserved Plasmodium protein, unknown function [Plasmodium knowlesi strain H]|uniref:Uncharacterized protein n=3 Tax=Plasmodium knowlesi TaxID=5850 RepID=A0A5K1VF02_PLAKH|nr:conserved Plasmodium protein, unknown function [Plasmodium knowlesi strain H]OTN66990.1 Uncharacterized protein PKNOH_S07440900 [Plasmodium knowlesi]CAA9988539.1 conserved Plasmodium protein, unknown function [Plasmodium knowlesi strain H]SBO21320.1 conserved Plasmodium protein, unknown function [Plasmodium knowlesi strain H]SBO21776.1 conserved Plasmodium protein, unknown function [Plasmodium knowlesi strain H]VVS78013.1 conserved Plasmodium protein, unknown function [Plasmodium knowlesi s|eukprot:XP_002259515.1 hypothetical protein, conserved in Plasmodium species [Plasmodium knowlesi strain H]